MRFSKLHGTANDYIYIDTTYRQVELSPSVIRYMCDRHRSIGGDGVVFIANSDVADFKMRMFNADGSEAEMCGNASRCVGKYVYDKGLTDKTEITLETNAGIKPMVLEADGSHVTSVTVDMGEPVAIGGKERLSIDGIDYEYIFVSMGNPHVVIFVEDVNQILIETIGPKIETHPNFSNRTNVEFARVVDSSTIEMRVWERGAGETLACGTGACATLVAASVSGRSDRQATLKLRGGDLHIDWSIENNHIYLSGAAEFAFDGEIDLPMIRALVK